MSITLSVDAMGGDHAPDIVIHGLSKTHIRHPDVRFQLYGIKEVIVPLLKQYPQLDNKSDIIHCSDVVAMDAKPSQIIRRSKETSLWQAVGALLENKADAIISAGNTGALMAIAKLRLRMIDPVDRPAIASLWPTMTGETIVMDMGANTMADPKNLLDFCLMGTEYARIIFDNKKPKIGLLNVGSEETKGHEIIKEADSLFKEYQNIYQYHYHGFVEGNDIAKGIVDVVVTDGFTGNVALKTAEGTAKLIGHYLKSSLTSHPLGKLGAWIAQKPLKAFKEKINPSRVNGGALLGVNGIVVKSHGGTDHIGFAAASELAIDLAKGNILEAISQKIHQHEVIKK